MASLSDVTHYRASMATLLTESVAMTSKLERWFDPTGEWTEAATGIDLNADPTATFRIMGALLLRKARLHTDAVLLANESNNMHSLAVQMRPVLECAGQIVFTFHNLIIAPDLIVEPDRAAQVLGEYMDADYYRTVIRVTKGEVGHDELLEQIWEAQQEAAEELGMPKPQKRKGRSFRQVEKVRMLVGGNNWYDYLSEYFCHGRADWMGASWRGGVVSMDTVLDEFTFAGHMDYLVEQLRVMNAYAALCPVGGDSGLAGDSEHGWVEATLTQLTEGRKESKGVRAAAVSVFSGGPAAEK